MRLDPTGPAAAAPLPWGVELADVAIPLDERAPGIARSRRRALPGGSRRRTRARRRAAAVSELVTNSLLHSGAPEGDDVVVRVHLRRGLCRVEVEDTGRERVVAPLAPDPARVWDGSGPGADAHLAWGVIHGRPRPLQLPCAAREFIPSG